MSYEETEYRKFTFKSEADKAINSLKGILLGINLDNEINEAELKEVENWSKEHYGFIDRYPFKELVTVIQGEIREYGALSNETVDDLLWVCSKFEHDNLYYDVATTDLQKLQGICHGILADGIVNDREVTELNKWLKEHEHLVSYYPYDEINSLISDVLSDGKIDEEERKRLLAYFNEFVNLSDQELTTKIENEITDITISGICTVDPQIEFQNKTFCFTGALQRASRSEISKEVERLGGRVTNSISKKTDYLIVGDNGNPCWAFACYGRKVEKAISLRKDGHNVSLIHEFDFWDFVEESNATTSL
jgi:hypothetical protein